MAADEIRNAIRSASDYLTAHPHEARSTDTPREQLAGFWIIQTRDLPSAVEWAKRAPLRSGAIEVRPLVSE